MWHRAHTYKIKPCIIYIIYIYIHTAYIAFHFSHNYIESTPDYDTVKQLSQSLLLMHGVSSLPFSLCSKMKLIYSLHFIHMYTIQNSTKCQYNDASLSLIYIYILTPHLVKIQYSILMLPTLVVYSVLTKICTHSVHAWL